jgi:hypothetical protein
LSRIQKLPSTQSPNMESPRIYALPSRRSPSILTESITVFMTTLIPLLLFPPSRIHHAPISFRSSREVQIWVWWRHQNTVVPTATLCISLCLIWKTAPLPVGNDLTATKLMPRTNNKLISFEQASYKTLSETGNFYLCCPFCHEG